MISDIKTDKWSIKKCISLGVSVSVVLGIIIFITLCFFGSVGFLLILCFLLAWPFFTLSWIALAYVLKGNWHERKRKTERIDDLCSVSRLE